MDAAIPIRWAMGGVFATLVTASTTTALLKQLRPAMDLSEVRLRVRSWWVMAAVFVGALALHRSITVAFLALIGVAAVVEMGRATKMVIPAAVMSTIAAYGIAATGQPSMFGWAAVAAPVLAAVVLVGRGAVEGYVAQVGATSIGALMGVSLAHMAAVLMLPGSVAYPAGGAGLLLFLVIVAQGGDVAQFLSGKAFGRRQLAARVSPNKTVAGLIGGVTVAAVLGGGLALLLTTRGWLWGGGIALAVALAGTAGDLIVSAIKRDCGIKDAGTLIPGHGGVLDRVDSPLLAAPLFFYLVSS